MSESDKAATGRTGSQPDIKRDFRRLGRMVRRLNDDLAEVARGAGDVSHSAAVAARRSGRETLAAVRRKRELAAASLRGRIDDHPGATLGIAFGIGVLVGVLATAAIRSRRDRPGNEVVSEADDTR